MKVFVTRYCLTLGIKEIDVERSIGSPNIVKCGYSCYHKNEWFLTLEEAIKNACERRDRKLKSLKASIGKLENLHF